MKKIMIAVKPDKSAIVSPALLCVQPFSGKPLFLPLQKYLLLLENKIAISISLNIKKIFVFLSEIIYYRGTLLLLLILCGSI